MASGTDLLLQVPWLAGVDIAELERIPLRRVEFAAGEWIFTPHTPAPDLFVIGEGKVEILDAGRADHLRLVTRAVAGDVIGEHRQVRRAPPWAARAAGPVVLYRWPATDLAQFLAEHGPLREALAFLAASRRLSLQLSFPWLHPEETIYALARKHSALLVRALILPLLAFTAGMGTLAAGELNGSGWAGAAGAGLAAFGVAFGIWRALDWQNDFYIATDRRVIWLEKVIGLYDNRQESPLRMILS
ncbi:MAG TPA: cyclic nucleotide-binding domain-containing protein, partial [Anaerolineales bacterium]|nr:cyclic nucleotide-binding domain-containing protein [Anaerolineales bacterium]